MACQKHQFRNSVLLTKTVVIIFVTENDPRSFGCVTRIQMLRITGVRDESHIGKRITAGHEGTLPKTVVFKNGLIP
jgi:hypothetical protein